MICDLLPHATPLRRPVTFPFVNNALEFLSLPHPSLSARAIRPTHSKVYCQDRVIIKVPCTIIVSFQTPSTSPTIRLCQSCSTHPASSNRACHSRSFPEHNRQFHLLPSQTPDTNTNFLSGNYHHRLLNMPKTKRVSRREKRKASSTPSSQGEDSRPHKALKPDADSSDKASSINMINSSDLRHYRALQRRRQQLNPQALDDWANPRGIRPPQGSGFRSRGLAVPRPHPGMLEQEEEDDDDEEDEEEDEGFFISYGGNNSEERDQRISGWAGSVAGAGAGDSDVGVEHNESSLQSSSPSPSGIANAINEDDEDKEDEDNENTIDAVEEDAVPSIETDNLRAPVEAATRAEVPAQLPNQTLRRSARHRQDPHVSIAHVPETYFDPVAHLNKPSPGSLDLSTKPQKAGVKDLSISPHVLFNGNHFIDQQTLFKSFNHASRKSHVLDPESSGVPIKSSEEGRNSTVHAPLGASNQNAAIKYFDRDHPANHGHFFTSNSVGENSGIFSSRTAQDAQTFTNRGYFPVSTLDYGGPPTSGETGRCVFSACPCHRQAAPRLPRRYVSPARGGPWLYHLTGEREFSNSLTSPSEAESHDDRDFFPDSGYEQHNLDYGSEPRENRDYFPLQKRLLDYDGDAQLKEEPASEVGDSAQEVDGKDDDGEDGSAGGVSPSAGENGAWNGGSDGEGPEGEEQEIKSEPDDSSSEHSDDDIESNESVRESENKNVSKGENVGENDSGSKNTSEYASIQTNNTTVTPTNIDPYDGRIRPPQSQAFRALPRLVLPSAPSYRPLIPHSAAMGTMRRSSNNALFLPECYTPGIIRPPRDQVLNLARRGGLPDAPFAGPQTRQSTTVNRMRNEPLSPGQGYASISIDEQQGAQMLHAYEGVESHPSGDKNNEGGEVEGEGEQGEGIEAEDGNDAGYDGDEE